MGKVSEWGKKFLARLASGFVFLLAKSELYSLFGELASGYPQPCLFPCHKH
jgi:hypothetical protein